ncbi:hypothetical protein [Deinococcus ruber]|uniref:Uncharacterized protein n=1 Tax=Deinococcus ruber TaxID=1848197 RepID=A0A918CLL2_9DEIO|nr:hypothetical protein [Deinococcus ruber]GGR31396.1 hypothetical protein GCM10008957_47630 [Deinococcus ruber]
MLDPNAPTLTDLYYALGTFSGPLTQRITDYLAGYQLGPASDVAGFQLPLQPRDSSADSSGMGTAYWVGPMVPREHKRYRDMQNALIKSFNFRNITQEGVEFLADGVGADEADWSLVSDKDSGDETIPLPAEEQALLDEAEQLLTAWWDHRDLPTTFQHLLQTAIAHGRAPLRPRIPERFKEADGRLKVIADPLKSLEPLHLVLPDVSLSGVYTDPESLERVGVTQVLYRSVQSWKTEWEVTYVNSDGKTILTVLTIGGEKDAQITDSVPSDPIDLNGRLWLFELKFPRGAITRDVLSNQDALNVALTLLSRNTHFAGFAQIYGIGIDPPVTGGETSTLSDGTVKPGTPETVVQSGPGTQSFFQPSVHVTTTRTTVNGVPVETIEEKPYAGASYNKIDPADPKAIEVAISTAETNIYSALRQRFVLMDDKATASGRSREVATGSFLRATARYATATEHLIREVLEFALEVAALAQGKPGKYRSLRASVTCRQQVFDPSPLQVAANLSLQQAGVISRQTLQTLVGIADPSAEDARIAEEKAPPETAPTPAPTDDQESATAN